MDTIVLFSILEAEFSKGVYNAKLFKKMDFLWRNLHFQ